MSNKQSEESKPTTTFHPGHITGYGVRFIPALIRANSRTNANFRPGFIVGSVSTLSTEFRKKSIDLNFEPHPADRTYFPNEQPTIEDLNKVLQRLHTEYALQEERVIVNDYEWNAGNGRWYSQFYIASRGFQIPTTISDSTLPDNQAVSVPEETAPPLEVSLGELAASKSFKKNKKDRRYQPEET
jgi:hypothetical protein